MAGLGIRPSILESLQPCSHSRGAIPDYTSTTSHSVVLDHVQFLGRTFWRVRKLTLSLTKRRAHIPSIKTAVLDLLTDWGPPLVEMPIEVHIRRIEQYHPRCVACHDMNLVGNHDYVMVYVARPQVFDEFGGLVGHIEVVVRLHKQHRECHWSWSRWERIPPPGGSHRLRRLARPPRTGTSSRYICPHTRHRPRVHLRHARDRGPS